MDNGVLVVKQVDEMLRTWGVDNSRDDSAFTGLMRQRKGNTTSDGASREKLFEELRINMWL